MPLRSCTRSLSCGFWFSTIPVKTTLSSPEVFVNADSLSIGSQSASVALRSSFLFRWVARTFDRWHYNHKNVRYKSILKYTLANMMYYFGYVIEVRTYPMWRLKYFDESHFRNSDLRRKRAAAPAGAGVRAIVPQAGGLRRCRSHVLTSHRSGCGVLRHAVVFAR
jgi:hypothetical protein